MRNWIIVTLIVGSICFIIAGKVSNVVKEAHIQKQQNVNEYIESIRSYIHSELGK